MFATRTFFASLVRLSVFVVGVVLLVSVKVFGFLVHFSRFCPWWVVKSPREISFPFRGFLFYGPQVDLFFFFFFACRMEIGHEEVSTSQVKRKRGTHREKPTASSLVAAMYVEELRLYNQIPIEISLETLDSVATSTIGEASNSVYFTRE